MTGPFSRKLIALALAFTFALAVFAVALAFRFLRLWWYVLGATRTWTIGLVMADSLAIRVVHHDLVQHDNERAQ